MTAWKEAIITFWTWNSYPETLQALFLSFLKLRISRRPFLTFKTYISSICCTSSVYWRRRADCTSSTLYDWICILELSLELLASFKSCSRYACSRPFVAASSHSAYKNCSLNPFLPASVRSQRLLDSKQRFTMSIAQSHFFLKSDYLTD